MTAGPGRTPLPDAAARDAPRDGLAEPALRRAMLVIFAGITLAVLDATLINVALPTIAQDLGATPSRTVLVVNAYQIAILTMLLPLATLGDRVGYRRIYRIGLLLFTGASAACLLARDVPELAFARAVQGLGAAGIMSVNGALVRMIFPRRRLARGIAMNSLIVAAASAAGPTIAAAVLAVGPWQWLFLINVPIGLAAFYGAMRHLPASPKAEAPFDLASALLSVLTFGLVFIGMDLVGHLKFDAVTAAILAIGLAVGAVFIRRQLDLPLPLLPVDLLRIPLFALSIGTSICSFAAQMIAFVSLPFFLQHGLGHSAVETGLLMTPWPLALMIAAPLSARLLDRCPAGLLGGIGLGIFCLGLILIATLPAAPGPLDIAWRIALCGIGFGLFQAPNNHTILTAGPAHRSGGASGMLGTARLTGQTIGATLVALGFGLMPGSNRIVMGVAAGFAAVGAVLSWLRVRVPRPQ